ncbi:MAG TPA: FkbM family methyltransferase [Pirellulaceae bacterium]|nr:FkbM family methyltransferase [Pirellulaceae bacterium]
MLVYEQLLRPCRLPWRKARIGREGDGGYIVFDRQLEHLAAVYSYGIGDDVSFDLALAHGYRLPIYQYDHTIRASPVEHDLFQFRRERGGAESLRRHLATNGHAFCRSLLLKMDIEGDEWDVINGCSDDLLGQFEQVVLEVHRLDRDDDSQAAALRRLNKLFHVRGIA